MALIYEPRGRAREYSPLAFNGYSGCNHGCRYCYCPRIFRTTAEAFAADPHPRAFDLRALDRECARMAGSEKHVLLSFTTDPYNASDRDHKITRAALETFLRHEIPAAVLTKGGSECIRDVDVFRSFGEHIKVGATLTFHDRQKSQEWEPGAALPEDRLETLHILHNHGVPTWVSFEPVIEPDESLALLRASLDFVDEYRVGKLNQFQGLDSAIDWSAFLVEAVGILRAAGKRFYVKQDLRKAAPGVALSAEETDMDRTIDVPFRKDVAA